jgi:uncharacterized membrane protein
MSDVLLVVVIVAFFVLAIALVQVLGRMIEHDSESDEFADEPPDTTGAVNRWGRPQ